MVNVIISADTRYSVNRSAIKNSLTKILSLHKVTSNIEIEILIAGDRKMRELNKKYRQIDETTDVLSFSLQETGKIGFITSPDNILRLGSIIISYPQAVLNASEKLTSIEEEINFLAEHGCNHLLGIHH